MPHNENAFYINFEQNCNNIYIKQYTFNWVQKPHISNNWKLQHYLGFVLTISFKRYLIEKQRKNTIYNNGWRFITETHLGIEFQPYYLHDVSRIFKTGHICVRVVWYSLKKWKKTVWNNSVRIMWIDSLEIFSYFPIF